MTPALKNRIMQAQHKLSEAEQRLEPLFKSLQKALDTKLAAGLLNTLHAMIPAYVAGEIPKASLCVFIEFVADELKVPREAVAALADFKIATFDFGLALREGYPSQAEGHANA